MKKKDNLQELTLSKSLVVNEEAKARITSAENGRYGYFDYSKENIEKIALKSHDEIKMIDAHTLAQALFPEHLICSGLIDCFLMFDIENNKRIDPPVYCYSNLTGYLNNNNVKKLNRLSSEIMDLFLKNDITWSEDWSKIFAKE